MKAKSGGGIRSNKVVHRPLSKSEPRGQAINLTAVSRLGAVIGNHSERGKVNVPEAPLVSGNVPTPVGPTDNVKAVGAGGGRTIHRAGSHGTHKG